MKKEQAAAMIDHTILRADAMDTDVLRLCDEAAEYRFASVCINPCHVSLAAKRLQGTGVKTCTVIGFPLGAATSLVKAFEARWAVNQGAEEVDMVINIGALKKGDDNLVKEDIEGVVKAAKEIKQDTIVKVIVETCLLTEEEKVRAIRLCLEAGADFVKTSTGFSAGGATKEDVALMRSIAGNRMSVKASGGIRSYESFLTMVKAGADRIGTSNGVAIIAAAE